MVKCFLLFALYLSYATLSFLFGRYGAQVVDDGYCNFAEMMKAFSAVVFGAMVCF